MQQDVLSYDEIQELAKECGKGNVEVDLKVISHLLKLVLQIWGLKLNNRSEAEKREVRGTSFSIDFFSKTETPQKQPLMFPKSAQESERRPRTRRPCPT